MRYQGYLELHACPSVSLPGSDLDREGCLPVGDEDLPAVNDLSKRDRLVSLPLLDCFGRLGEDDKVVLLALVVDLDLVCFTASHDCV